MFAVLRFPNFSVSGVATLGAFAGYVAYGAGLQVGGLAGRRLRGGGRGRPAARPAWRTCRWSSRARCRPPSPRSRRAGAGERRAASASATSCAATTGRSRATAPRATSASARSRSRPWRIALAIMLAVFAALAFTRIGKAMRAVGRQSRAGRPQGHPARQRVAHDGELRRHGAGRRRRHAARARHLDRSADRLRASCSRSSPPRWWAASAACPARWWAPS